MKVCKNLVECAFFKEYEGDEDRQMSLKSFTLNFCYGETKDRCVRMMVCKELGGPAKVPVNMMPTGHAYPGTNNSDWPENVKNVLRAA